jgi:hypothetical protein
MTPWADFMILPILSQKWRFYSKKDALFTNKVIQKRKK